MPKEPYVTMPEFAKRTQRPVHEIKKLVLSGELPAVPRFANRDNLADPLCVPMIALSEVEAYHVDRARDPASDPGARSQIEYDKATANRHLQVSAEIDAGDPRVRYEKAKQQHRQHMAAGLENLNEMAEARKAIGEIS